MSFKALFHPINDRYRIHTIPKRNKRELILTDHILVELQRFLSLFHSYVNNRRLANA